MLYHIWQMLVAIVGLLGILVSFQSAAYADTMKACEINRPPQGCRATNMWAVRSEMDVPNGAYVNVPNPGCLNDSQTYVNRMIQAAIVTNYPQLALYSGALSDLAATPINDFFRTRVGGDFSRLFSPYSKNGAMCAPMVMIVPARAQVVGFRLEATDAQNGMVFKECAAGPECVNIGWSRYQGEPTETSTAETGMRTYTTVFMNWSNDRVRKIRVTLFYNMPGNDVPLRQM